jgi:hypothetical protein
MIGRAPLAPTMQGAQNLRSEAQRRRWTFYETNNPHFAYPEIPVASVRSVAKGFEIFVFIIFS